MDEGDEDPSRWSDINLDILIRIFQKINLADLLLGVPFVCRSWREASANPLCWKSLDLKSWESMFTRVVPRGTRPIVLDFKKFLKFAVNRSFGTLTSIVFPRADVTDTALLYVANRCPCLKRIVFNGRCNISNTALCKAIRHWAELEFIDMNSAPLLCKEMIIEIGETCKNFAQLRTMGRISEEEVIAIATKLPQLRILNLSSSTLTNKGLLVLLDGCKALECLDVTDCVYLKINEEVLEKASRLKEFEHGGNDLDDDGSGFGPTGCFVYEEYVFGEDGRCHGEMHMVFR